MAVVTVVSLFALVATIWIAFRELGWREDVAGSGATLLLSGLLLWTEPVQRALFLGQVELVLMALVVWDLCQPDRRRWKGAATGIAAGIKLVPLLFIAYLLLTRRFRQAAVAAAAFVVTVIIGFIALPNASVTWWLDGNFFQAGRTGFVGDQQNQSLRGIMTRLIGSVNGTVAPWLLVAIVVGAARPGRRGHPGQRGLHLRRADGGRAHRAARLADQLGPPLGVDRAGAGADRRRRRRAGRPGDRARAAWYALAAAVLLLFGGLAGLLVAEGGPAPGRPDQLRPGRSFPSGDNPAYAEYHWHGLQLLAGKPGAARRRRAVRRRVRDRCRVAASPAAWRASRRVTRTAAADAWSTSACARTMRVRGGWCPARDGPRARLPTRIASRLAVMV